MLETQVTDLQAKGHRETLVTPVVESPNMEQQPEVDKNFVQQNGLSAAHQSRVKPHPVQSNQLAGANPDGRPVNATEMSEEQLNEGVSKNPTNTPNQQLTKVLSPAPSAAPTMTRK